MRATIALAVERIGGGRLSAFVAGTVAAALVGMFVGNVLPFWDAERADERGSVELQRALAAKEPIPTRIAALERAQIAFEEATRDDVYFARPWIELAAVEYLAWTFRGAPRRRKTPSGPTSPTICATPPPPITAARRFPWRYRKLASVTRTWF